MFSLAVAILTSASTGILMRVGEKRIRGKIGMLAVNYFICAALAAITALYAGTGSLFPAAEGGFTFTLLLGAANGLLYLVSFVLLQWNVTHNGVVISSTFQKLGVIVPITVAIVCYGEQPGLPQLAGYAGALIAIALIHFDGGDRQAGQQLPLFLLLFLGGTASALSKVFERAALPALESRFLLYTFLSALILSLLLMAQRHERIGAQELLFGFIIGVPNYFSASFLLRSLNAIPAVIAFPIYSVGGIMVSSLAGVLLFREKLSRRRWIALGLVMVSIVLLNL